MKKCERRRILCAVIGAITAGTCAPSALAGDADLAGLDSAPTHQQFIVHYRTNARAMEGDGTLQAMLDRASASSLGPHHGVRLQRRMAIGPAVVRADRPLDVAEAARWMETLAADPRVEHVEIDQIMTAAFVPNDPLLRRQWGFGASAAAINIRPAWDKATGKGQVIAVIDTGRTLHPDLDANHLPGHDFISNPAVAGDGNGRDADPTDVGDASDGRPSSWHGTHVAGTVAAQTGNGVGVAGTAFDAAIVPVRVLGRGGGTFSDVADAMVWAAGGHVTGVPDNANPARVLNLSLGGLGQCGRAAGMAVARARELGATVVVAAGNQNTDVSRVTPANCPGVVAVAATTSAGSRAGFSNHGAGITLAAPGQNILSTLNDGVNAQGAPSYAAYNGTSMAAPHVAGVVALMQSAVDGRLDPGQVTTILKQTARPLPGACPQGCGAGIVDADAAVTMAMQLAASAPE